ncbi:TetR/AcrR family transcriptional regulator [uncultured Jatrophihabitans sp.]|uniref:TetR/AcrR family transcriptional regulator n=1 Tax=uncultured Jatrophihabitans sp. TaxID=1610747 RepID=UPI0035CBAB71
MTGSDTRAKLLTAAQDALRDDGIAALSARSIAARAGVNQALVFYHFNSVGELVETACRRACDDSVLFYREQFAAVGSLAELLEVGRELHERERGLGNVAMMAQLMAGAQRDDVLASAARYAMSTWNAEIESVVRRVLVGSAFADIADPAGLARAISAGFIGLELYDGIDRLGAQQALDALQRLGVLVEVMDDLGPVASRALRARVRRTSRAGRATHA